MTSAEANPFLRYRELLDSYRRATDVGLTDEWFVETVERIDDAVAKVDGHGFITTPLRRSDDLAQALGLPVALWAKIDGGNVSGSHKSRHLFGVALHRAVDAATGSNDERGLAIASCGNAALAAGVIARATEQPLQVFIPDWAPESTVARLESLDAAIQVCVRQADEAGDPCFLRYREAVAAGATPFTVQGPESPTTIDGGRTIGWELAEQLHDHGAALDRIFIQIGGGALATAAMQGLADGVDQGWLPHIPIFHAVQTEGCWPLPRAWDLLAERLLGEPVDDRAAAAAQIGTTGWQPVLAHARNHPSDFMWAWEDEPHSLATGILDDVTYDWATVVEAMLSTGGHPIVANESDIVQAHSLANQVIATPHGLCPTGTSGLGGALTLNTTHPESVRDQRIGVLFTGAER